MPKSKRPTERLSDLDKAPRIEKMREQGKSWNEIAEKMKMTPGRAQFILTASQVRPKDRIKYTKDDLEDAGKKIVAARDKQKMPWPLISARIGLTEGRVKDIYRRVKNGEPAGGSRGGSSNGKPRSTKKTAAKSARTRKTAAKPKRESVKASGSKRSKRTARRKRERATALQGDAPREASPPDDVRSL